MKATRTLADRLAARLVEQPNGCLEFSGSRLSSGYGVIGLGRREDGKDLTHRVAWSLANGRRIPDGMVICHRCDNPPCCNPDHLFLGTYRDNNQDAIRKGRSHQPRDLCVRGHDFRADAYFDKDGKRLCCAVCHRDRQAQYRERRRQERRAS